jgi:RNA exonuclease 1
MPERYEGLQTAPLAFPQGDAYAIELLGCLEPTQVMEKNGYAMHQLTDGDLNLKRRCSGCNQSMYLRCCSACHSLSNTTTAVANLTKGLQKTLLHQLNVPIPPPPHAAYKPLPAMEVPLENGFLESQPCMIPCVFHPGTIDGSTKCYDCCGQHVSEPKPCCTSDVHRLREYQPGHLQRLYQLYPTPPSYNAKQENRPLRDAVSIDCEMGTAVIGDPELIRVSAIDYYTGEVLVNNLVATDQPMQHLNTKYSGVTWGQMNHALRTRKTLDGKAGARNALWRFVGPHTILVGHGVSNDLRAMRWIHPRVVDSLMIENKIVQAKKALEAAAAAAAAEEQALKDAELQSLGLEVPAVQIPVPEPKTKKPKGTGDLALKTLVKKYLGQDVQMQGKKGHDSLEDAISARDLVHWMVMRRLAENMESENQALYDMENDEEFDGMN